MPALILPALAHRGLAPRAQERLPCRGVAERDRRALEARHRHALVIGWRIMLMTLLGRELPDLAAEVLSTDLEIAMLQHEARTGPRSTHAA
jgi:hypothetical protein